MATRTLLRHQPSRCSWITTQTVETMKPSEGLSLRHVLTWRQAAELYEDNQLGISAEAFLELSELIDQELESTMCLINAAILFAQLGETHTAAEVLDTADPPKELIALVMFILGHVEAQQSHYARAQDCLKIAVDKLSMEVDRKMDYRLYGLDFSVSVADCRYSLFILRTMKDRLFDEDEGLGSLPVDSLFKAPGLQEEEDEAPLSPVSDVSVSRPGTRSSLESCVPTLTDQSMLSSLETSPTESSAGAHDSGVWCLPAPVPLGKVGQRAISPLRYSLFPKTSAKTPGLDVCEIAPPSPSPAEPELDGLRRITLTDDHHVQDQDANDGIESRDIAAQRSVADELLHSIMEEVVVADEPAPILPTKSPRRRTGSYRAPAAGSGSDTATPQTPMPPMPPMPVPLLHPLLRTDSNATSQTQTLNQSPAKSQTKSKSKRFGKKKIETSHPPKVIRPTAPTRTPSVMSRMSWKSTFSRRSRGEERTGYASVHQRRLEAEGVTSFADFFGGFGKK